MIVGIQESAYAISSVSNRTALCHNLLRLVIPSIWPLGSPPHITVSHMWTLLRGDSRALLKVLMVADPAPPVTPEIRKYYPSLETLTPVSRQLPRSREVREKTHQLLPSTARHPSSDKAINSNTPTVIRAFICPQLSSR